MKMYVSKAMKALVGIGVFCILSSCGGGTGGTTPTTATVTLSPASGAQAKNVVVSATFSEAIDVPASWTDYFTLKVLENGQTTGEDLCTQVAVDPDDPLTYICTHDDLVYGTNYQITLGDAEAAANVNAAATPGAATATFIAGVEVTGVTKTTVASEAEGTVTFSVTFDAALPSGIDPMITAGALTSVTCDAGADRTQFTCAVAGVGGCKSFTDYSSTFSVPNMMEDVAFMFNSSDDEFNWSNDLRDDMIADHKDDACWGSEGLGLPGQDDFMDNYSVNLAGSESMLLLDFLSPVHTDVFARDYAGLYRELPIALQTSKIAILSKTVSPVSYEGNTGEWVGIAGNFLNFDNDDYYTGVFHGLLPTAAGNMLGKADFTNAATFEYFVRNDGAGRVNIWEPNSDWLTGLADTLYSCVIRDGASVQYYVSADGETFTLMAVANTSNAGFLGAEIADLETEPVPAGSSLEYYTIIALNQAGAVNAPVDITNTYAPMVDYVRLRTSELDGDGAEICAEMSMIE